MQNFLNDESGAITVDWVVLTAGVCGFGMAIATLLFNGASAPSSSLNTALASDVVGDHTSFDD